ncbi:MAG: nitroreductase family protein [Deltaproteobacteria bacterium]|nr:nitroreductase family protein [Deltaproteobacteria bacterium]
MNIREAIKNRRSIRRFQDKALTAEEVDILCEAVMWAPSAGNLQSRRFYFVLNPDLKKRIATVCLGQMFIASAPLVVVACADYERIRPYRDRGKNLYAIQDVACAVENLMLQAHELGLGSVCVGAFDEDALSGALNLPSTQRPLTVVPVGHPAQKPEAPERYPMEEIVTILK